MNKLQENIENIRKEKGVKQTLLAEILGIKQSSYSAYITKNDDMKYSTLCKIADALNVRVIDLITYPDEYIPAGSVSKCNDCQRKNDVIQSLTNYIKILEDKLNLKK